MYACMCVCMYASPQLTYSYRIVVITILICKQIRYQHVCVYVYMNRSGWRTVSQRVDMKISCSWTRPSACDVTETCWHLHEQAPYICMYVCMYVVSRGSQCLPALLQYHHGAAQRVTRQVTCIQTYIHNTYIHLLMLQCLNLFKICI